MAHAPQFGVPGGFHADPALVTALERPLRERRRAKPSGELVDIHGVRMTKATSIDAIEHICDESGLYTVGACEGWASQAPRKSSAPPYRSLETG